MNDTMRTLTIFAAISLPLTLVVGIYSFIGMDFITDLPSGFIILVATLIIIIGVLFYLFFKKDWIILKENKILPKENPAEN